MSALLKAPPKPKSVALQIIEPPDEPIVEPPKYKGGTLESHVPCCRCPLYKGKESCCVIGKSFDQHPNIQRLVNIASDATDSQPQSLCQIVAKVVQQSGNRMNFRRQTIVQAVMCVLHRLPNVGIDKQTPSRPLYNKESD